MIIDTDPGIDDVLALLYASRESIKIDGLTTVFGNSSIDNTTANAYMATRLLGLEVPIYKGASYSLKGRTSSAESSGRNGNNNLQENEYRTTYSTQLDAVSYIARAIRSVGSLELVCIGPVTNLAMLCNLYPDLISSIKRVLIMAGIFSGKGNVSEYAEFNAYADPDALKQVLKVLEMNRVKTVLFPADICREVRLTKTEVEDIVRSTNMHWLKKFVNPYIEYYESNTAWGGYDGAVLYDVLPMVYAVNEELFTVAKGSVRVETNNEMRLGLTTFEENKALTIGVVTGVDAKQVKRAFLKTVMQGANV